MDLDRLRQFLSPQVGANLDHLYDEFRREGGATDMSAFAALLHERKMISREQLRAFLTTGDVAFTLSEATNQKRKKADPPPSASQIGRYRLLGLLGKGAMGEVHVARDVDLHRNVALKRMDPAIAGHPALAGRFYTEVQITAQLDHPSIVPVYGLERDKDGVITYAMKLVQGETLEAYLEETKQFFKQGKRPDTAHDLPARLELFLHVCDAMAYAHTRGVVHRDLKPENIMVGAFSQIVVMDWGIAKLIGAAEADTGNVTIEDGQRAAATQLGMAVGTPAYMSPEQAQGLNAELDGASDQYALGLILYEIVCLKRAITGKTPQMVIARAADGDKDDMASAPGERVPPELAAIITKATEPSRKRRYADVAALAEDVRRYLRDEAVLARPDRPAQRMGRWISHHRQATLGMVIVLLLMVFGVAVVTITGGIVALEVNRYSAAVREEKLGEVLGVVSSQSHRMDTEFRHYEGLLRGLSFAAEHVLTVDPVVQEYYTTPEYKAGQGPPDLRDSSHYSMKVSLDHPDLTLATGVPEDESIRRRFLQLSMLQPHFERVMLRSKSEESLHLDPAGRWKLLGEDGVPVIWAYAATEEGILAASPGTGEYPDPYDPRTRPWYILAKNKKGPQWGEAYVDESGMGLLVPCSAGLYDRQGQFVGIAAIDITVGYIIDTLLDPPGLAGKAEAYLVNPKGKIVVQSSLKEKAKEVSDHEPPDFPYPQVVAAVQGGAATGHFEIEGPDGELRMLAWSHLEAVDWIYVVEGRSEDLLAAW